MLNREPTIIINGLSELIRQILPLMVVVGLIELPPEKLAGWISLTGLILAFISTTVLRSNVVSNDTANKQIQEGINSPHGTKIQTVIENVEAKNN